MPVTIIAGEPGTSYTNDTGKILWQYHAESSACGLCIQFTTHIGPFWPLPIHRSCRCRQILISPGATAHPFADFREIIDGLSPVQRNRVIGASNLKLVESGAVEWGDVVTAGRIRTLAEVVGREKLTVKQLEEAGLSPARARLAFASAHPEELETARRSAKALADILKANGMTAEAIAKGAGAFVAGRVGIKDGPSGASGMPARPVVPIMPMAVVEMIRTPRPPETPIRPDEARRLIVAAIGEEAAARLDRLPATIGELQAEITRLNGTVNQEAYERMRAYLGIK